MIKIKKKKKFFSSFHQYLILVFESLNTNQYSLFTIFGYLFDCQSIFHYFRRSFILIKATDSIPYQFCNLINLILIITLRPYVHLYQFNWLYTIYNTSLSSNQETITNNSNKTTDYLWFVAILNASLHTLDTFFLLFDYLSQLINNLQEFNIQTHQLPHLNDDLIPYTKLRRYDSDNEIIYFWTEHKMIE